jgi:uncharacterized protein YegP (UPF0339 family)
MKIEVYKSKDGWRWRAVARNGKITADSGEAYTRECDAKRARTAFIKSIRTMLAKP